jgi:hypothetical protein
MYIVFKLNRPYPRACRVTPTTMLPTSAYHVPSSSPTAVRSIQFDYRDKRIGHVATLGPWLVTTIPLWTRRRGGRRRRRGCSFDRARPLRPLQRRYWMRPLYSPRSLCGVCTLYRCRGGRWGRYGWCVVDEDNKDVQKHDYHQHDECGDRGVCQL